MSKVERKEYQETQIMRTVSPVRTTRTSTQNLAEFDNNLDYLLEDLQSSVSRPGSSLGNHYTTNSLNRVTNLKPANPVTEYSSDDAYSYTSPDGTRSVKTYKKESYSYKTGGDSLSTEKVRMQNNINQLDSLLDDLQQAKQGSYNNVGVDSSLQNGKIASSKKVVQHELHYGDTQKRTVERSSRENSVTRDVQYNSEGTYGDIKHIRHPSPTRSNTSTLTKQTKVTNVHSYPVEVMETTTPDINPEILANLDPGLLPSGNTKVTTTIKTYTYELPGEGGPGAAGLDGEKYVYSMNESQTTPSKSFVFNKYENKESSSRNYVQEPVWKDRAYKEVSSTTTVNKSNGYMPPYKKPSPPIGGQTVLKETITTRNYQPGYSPELHSRSGKETYVYNETTTNRNYDGYQANERPRYGSRPPSRDVPTQTSAVNVVKEIRDNGTNQNNYYPAGDGPYYPNNNREVETFNPKHPPGGGGRPGEPLNITYLYKTQSTTTNNYRSYNNNNNEESQPLLHSRPFPTDGGELDGPPRRVDDLMATIGNEPPNSPLNAGFNAHEAELVQQRKIESMKLQQQRGADEKKKDLPMTKNVTGPPVYYPPGHEMFAKKEESGAWRAEGAMAKESGKYKYEAESKSKSKSSSGAAIVPVCLPLCCGLPCTIL